MKKRILSILLVLVMVVGVMPTAAFAADETPRDTEFFTDYTHTDLNFSDMEFERLDVDAALAEMDQVRALLGDPANVEAVRAGFDAVVELQLELSGMDILVNIHNSQDVTDATALEDLEYAEEAITLVRDGMFALLRDILNSPCAAAADHLELTEEDMEYLREYEEITEEELERQNRETALVNEYWAASIQTFTTEFDGQTWDDDTAYAAYYYDELSYEDYVTISRAIAKEKNAVLGEIYMELVEVRNEVAEAYGYETYSDYAYENTYLRDYTPEEIRSFHAGVKESIIPIYEAAETLFYAGLSHEAFWVTYDSEMIFDAMEPCLSQMSDELLEAITYMQDHGLYDIDYSEVKSDQGYTTQFPGYNAPFFYNAPYGNVQDLTTAIHEFGHYNNYYWQEPVWYTASKSIDIAEVHSQGMELLFTHFYPDLFGDGADEIETYVVYSLLSSIVNGALYDELQQYVYATENVTLQQINEEYCRLCREYGLIEADDPRTEMYGWVDVHHNFSSPCYYISYAVSAAGAFNFWLEGREDFDAAVDSYLEFVALNADYDFQESFETLGMENPLTAEYLAELADALYTELDVENRLNTPSQVGPFTDVTTENPYAEAIGLVYEAGLMNGTGSTTFSPDSTMSRAMLATVLYRLVGEPEPETTEAVFTDVNTASWYGSAVTWAWENGLVNGYGDDLFGPTDALTREQAVVILWRFAQTLGVDVSVDGDASFELADGESVSRYARSAVRWACELGILGVSDEGTVDPKGEVTRAEAAQMLVNFIFSI